MPTNADAEKHNVAMIHLIPCRTSTGGIKDKTNLQLKKKKKAHIKITSHIPKDDAFQNT